jgi:hypothetical protein
MATRDLTSAIVDSLDDEVLQPFFAIEMLFDGNKTLRLWTGVGELDYQGNSWYGAGTMLGVEAVEETTEIAAKGATISLSGVPAEVLSLALNEPYQGRKANIYFGTFNGGASLSEIFSGYMDQMNIEETANTCTISLTLENKLVDLERPRVSRFTSSYQKSVYSGDRGFDFVEELQDKEIVWGRVVGN